MGTRINIVIGGQNVGVVLFSNSHHPDVDAEKILREKVAAKDVSGISDLTRQLLAVTYPRDHEGHKAGDYVFSIDVEAGDSEKVLIVAPDMAIDEFNGDFQAYSERGVDKMHACTCCEKVNIILEVVDGAITVHGVASSEEKAIEHIERLLKDYRVDVPKDSTREEVEDILEAFNDKSSGAEIFWKECKMFPEQRRYFAVTGRIVEDDEDAVHMCTASSVSDAASKFFDRLRATSGEESPEIVINYVLNSAAPITCTQYEGRGEIIL